MYCSYMKRKSKSSCKQNNKIMGLDHFYRWAKLAWLILILQTFKVFVFYRIRLPKSQSNILPYPDEEFYTKFIGTTNLCNVFANNGLIILGWLQCHFDIMRTTQWCDNKFLSMRTTVSSNCLNDGFIYAAVTLAYCPYLKEHFEKLIPQPISYEEFLHNNIVVVESWKMLGASLELAPQNLCPSHSLSNLIITSYLFEFLPTLYPTETIQFKTGLSQCVTKHLEICNTNDFPVAYKVIFFGNDDICFSTNLNFYVIQPRKKCKITITYRAKFGTQRNATLILNGECKGYHYAKNKALTLIGIPDLQYVTTTITVEVKIYIYKEISYTIKSPYPTEATYEIRLCFGECTELSDLRNLLTVDDYRQNKLLPRLFIENPRIRFDADGVGYLKAITNAFTLRTVPLWVYFCNSAVGDFAINISIKVNSHFEEEILEVVVPREFYETKNIDNIREYILDLHIPCQNNLMWNSIISYMFKVYPEEIPFWKHITSK